MYISEDDLRAMVQRILAELQGQKISGERKKIYMVCGSKWDERYQDFLKDVEKESGISVHPVIPKNWKALGYEAALSDCPACAGIRYWSCDRPGDLDRAVTVFPVVSRSLIAKAALCIGDTFETQWIAACIGVGGNIIFLKTGLDRFTGLEPEAYREQIKAYYKQILSYGIEICEEGPAASLTAVRKMDAGAQSSSAGKPESSRPKKRVITASNVAECAEDGVLHLGPHDLMTDLARDRAKFLKIEIR